MTFCVSNGSALTTCVCVRARVRARVVIREGCLLFHNNRSKSLQCTEKRDDRSDAQSSDYCLHLRARLELLRRTGPVE